MVGRQHDRADGEAALDPRVAHTRRQVLAAAVAELTEVGFERVSIDAIAERSGVARSTIYRNWDDRTVLLAEAFDQLMAGGPADLAPAGDLGADLEQLAWLLIDKLTSDEWRRVVPSLLSAATHDEALARLVASFAAERRLEARALFVRALARGEITRPSAIDSALERFVAPFFYRRLFDPSSLDGGFVAAQVAATLEQLGAEGA